MHLSDYRSKISSKLGTLERLTNITVVDNIGTMDANPKGMLSTANPFYLDVETLLSHYGVSVLQTPTLLTEDCHGV